MTQPATTYSVLAVDDSDDDLLLLKMAFRKAGRSRLVHLANGGEEAISYLRGDGNFADRSMYPIPHLILLDLKMPRFSGYDVLEAMNSLQLEPRPIVIAFSCSALAADMERALALGARHYEVKPASIMDLNEVIARLEANLDNWLKV